MGNIIKGLIIILITLLIIATALGISLMFDQKAKVAMENSGSRDIVKVQQRNPLTTVVGKTIIIYNIRIPPELQISVTTLEYSFNRVFNGNLYTISYNGEIRSEIVKISEQRFSDGLSVNLTDFVRADYPYWAELKFYDNGNFASKDYDGDIMFAEWKKP